MVSKLEYTHPYNLENPLNPIDFLLEVFKENVDNAAIIHNDLTISYQALLEQYAYWYQQIEKKIGPHEVVAIQGDFSPETVALFLALTARKAIIVPIIRDATSFQQKTFLDISGAQHFYKVLEDESVAYQALEPSELHPLYSKLIDASCSGLVLFTSGSSGTPKATVHNFERLLDKFRKRRPASRMVNFLLFDHWGGLNTMFHILSNGGCLITIQDRSADSVCEHVEKYQIEVLPASPTFLNLLLLSGAHQRYDLSSLKTITYGTEPMPSHTLDLLSKTFPDTKLQQTYGLIEMGVMRSKSKSSNSLWVKLSGEGFEWRVVDDILQIKSHSTMLGYLNAEAPFTDDGWFITGDQVIVDGEYLKILGRKSELINIGGEKVFPVEVENIILSMDNVLEVTVFANDHPLTGKILCAKVKLAEPENKIDFKNRMIQYCVEKLPKYKIPMRITLSDQTQSSYRMKKIRMISEEDRLEVDKRTSPG